MPDHSRHEALEELLTKLFDINEFLRLARHLDPERGPGEAFPTGPISTRDFFDAAVAALSRRGLIDSRFFRLLLQARPRRAGEIQRVHDLWCPNEAPGVPQEPLERWATYCMSSYALIYVVGVAGVSSTPSSLGRAFVPLDLRPHADNFRRDDLSHWSTQPPLRREIWTLNDAVDDVERSIERGDAIAMRGLALVGAPGCGKTTILRHFWCRMHKEGARQCGWTNPTLRPVLLRAASCNPDRSAHEMLKSALESELEGQGFTAVATSIYRSDRPVLWLLDGLDEVGPVARRQRLASVLAQAMELRPDDRYILTCRSAGWRDVGECLAGRLRTFDVAGLTDEAIDTFITRWYDSFLRAVRGSEAEVDSTAEEARLRSQDLISIVRSGPWLVERRDQMRRNPLLLSGLCRIHLERRLPDQRALLYEYLLRIMLQDHRRFPTLPSQGSEPATGLPFDEGCHLLGALAWYAHDRGDGDLTEMTTAEAASCIERILGQLSWFEGSRKPTALEVLARAELDCGVLHQVAPDVWQFAHLTFQEYLAARHAANTSAGGALLAARARQDCWAETIRLAMRLPRLPDEFFRALFSDPGAPWGDTAFQALLSSCVREAYMLEAAPFVEAIQVALGQGTNDGLTRAKHIMALFAGTARPAALNPLWRRIEEEELRIRQVDARVYRDRLPPAGAQPGDAWVMETQEIAFVWIPGGSFHMGAAARGRVNQDPDAYEDEGPVHRVVLTRGYWLGQVPVTNAQYRRFTSEQGFREPTSFTSHGFDDPAQPVTGVDWDDARAYCAWLGRQLDGRLHACLPTEAQWERAARGDDGRRFPWGNQSPDATRAVYGGVQLSVVGARPAGAGPYGTLDQAGQVWEWCRDEWRSRYKTGTSVDPCYGTAQKKAPLRVVRGGSWGDSLQDIRAACRCLAHPESRNVSIGFRVCIEESNRQPPALAETAPSIDG